MAQRINYVGKKSESLSLLYDMEKYLNKSSISKTIRDLVKIRASKINKCSFCVDMHTKAALQLTEHLTLLPEKGVPDSLYNHVRTYFDEQQFIDLVLVITQINAWARVVSATGKGLINIGIIHRSLVKLSH